MIMRKTKLMANNPNPLDVSRFPEVWVGLNSIVGWCFCVFYLCRIRTLLAVVAARFYHPRRGNVLTAERDWHVCDKHILDSSPARLIYRSAVLLSAYVAGTIYIYTIIIALLTGGFRYRRPSMFILPMPRAGQFHHFPIHSAIQDAKAASYRRRGY